MSVHSLLTKAPTSQKKHWVNFLFCRNHLVKTFYQVLRMRTPLPPIRWLAMVPPKTDHSRARGRGPLKGGRGDAMDWFYVCPVINCNLSILFHTLPFLAMIPLYSWCFIQSFKTGIIQSRKHIFIIIIMLINEQF